MKKHLLTFILFTGLSSLAYSHSYASERLAATTGSENTSSFTDASFFDAGQPENGVVFYPNPVVDYMSVRFPQKGNHTVVIFNIIGEKIMEKSAYDVEIVELNLRELQKGMYFVSYESGGKIVTKRFSKAQ
jgi:hypothetical protein